MQVKVLKDFEGRPGFLGVAWEREGFHYHVWVDRETLRPTHGYARPMKPQGIHDGPKPLDMVAEKAMIDEAIAAFVELAIS